MSVPSTTITGISGFHKGRTATFRHGLLTIGRDRSNGMSFPLDLTLSREHAKIVFEFGTWVAKDLGSRNGTYVNGQLLPPGGSAHLRSGDQVKCGFQTFRLEWAQAPAPSPPPAAKPTPLPTNPVTLKSPPQPTAPPPTYRIPAPPPNVAPKPKAATGHRWVAPGEVVEIHGRRIVAGMFYFGMGMRDGIGYGIEPALIDPAYPVGQASDSADLPVYYPTYLDVGPVVRARFLDWLAAGRPPEGMTDASGLIFLAGIERRHLGIHGIEWDGFGPVIDELRRLVAGAPRGSQAAVRMHQFLTVTGALPLPPAEIPLTESVLEEIRDGGVPERVRLLLARRASTGEPLNAVEALLVTVMDESTYPRTPFFRCLSESLALFARRYERKYPKGVAPKVLVGALPLGYAPANARLQGRPLPDFGLKNYRIAPATIGKLREFLTEATDALDAYSRRLAGRLQEAGQLPAVALLPAEIAETHPAIDSLAVVARTAAERGGRLGLVEVASLWMDWPSERALNRQERELLAKALWHAGFVSEPSPASAGTLVSDGTVFVAPRDAKSIPDSSHAFDAATPLVSIAALVVLADGRLGEEEREKAKTRLGTLLPLEAGDTVRLGLYLDWILESGAPKVGKKAFGAVEPGLRRPLIQFLAEVAAADGNVAPAEVKEIVRIAKALGILEDEVYPLLHQVHAEPAAARPRKTGVASSGHGLDMELVASKLASSRAATEILGAVFVEEEEEAPSVVFAPADETVSDDPTRLLLEELLTRPEWPASEFAALVHRHGKMPSAAYDDLNEAAYDAVGDPLLEGDDPITVDQTVGQELLQ